MNPCMDHMSNPTASKAYNRQPQPSHTTPYSVQDCTDKHWPHKGTDRKAT